MRSITKIPNAADILLLSLWIPTYSFAGVAEQQVCDVGADYFPGMEEYSEAIHRRAEDERALASQTTISRTDSFLPAGEIRGSE